MYRRSKKYQTQVALLAKARAARERKRLEPPGPSDITELPELRRVIEITDYDFGSPVVHRIELFRSDQIDCYNVTIDGQPWQKRMGWTRILASLRKALPRLRQMH
ncbi:hypothetical protein MIB92_02020 [Aestuariirhabdus sp. Z084]|uniref:hypothetical protein n=1 Tax=Aestuariirhabdus haliotis TaxID=2918751 RepID=UPI00201B3DBE|nr:hypothetical protein [Aestuariirhabdus haliotis]MCL6414416.1 hypothetical protein [Aestuariirhabdus haliotis]MCL6418348.1 hypothetical protein [Aestuariirhabdus haliotis]